MESLLEPFMLKAFRLLHSKDKDSGDQLKQMLDEAIRHRNETQSQDNKLPKALTMIKKEAKKVKMEVINDVEDVPLSKRQKESPRTSQPSSPSTSRSPQHSRSVSPSVSAAQRSEDSNSLIDADDLAQEIMDLHCVVCTGLDVTSGNQLVECHECRGLYHQECHRPSISDAEANDPRLVWLCSNCNKSAKSSKNTASASRTKPGSNRESPVTFRSRSDSPSVVSGSKSSSALKSGSSTVKPSASKSTTSSSSSSTSSSSSASGTVNSSLMNADKRLQIIKKRAATKLQEKRKPGK